MVTPRPFIADLPPYVPGKARLSGVDRVIRLASNESALGPSPAAVTAAGAALTEAHRYPDPAATALRAAIAERYGLDPDRIVCGNGSDDLLGLLARAYLGPGDEAIMSRYGFAFYPIATIAAGATPVRVDEPDRRTTVDGLLAHVTPRTRMVFLANPNNPTGHLMTRDEIHALRAGLPDRVVLVLDAAYAEFVDRHDYSPGVELVGDGDNTVMTRTFSKLFALGGLRLGWAYCPPAIAEVLNRLRDPFNVNAVALAAGAGAMADIDMQERARRHNDEWRPWLTGRLRALGLDVADSAANFVTVRVDDAAGANAALNARGIIVRPLGSYDMADSLRITIGTGPEMQAVVDALAGWREQTG